MATYTSNYGWTKPGGNDQVDIGVLNNNLDDQDGVIHDAFLNMAEPFSELSTYSVGEIVLYGTKTYKCRVAVTTAGSWTGATNWDEYKLSEGGSSTGGEVKNLDNGMLSHSTDSSYITVNLDVALTAGKEYKITLRDPAYNYVDTKQITWTATTDVIFEGNGGGQYKIQLTQTTASLYNYSGQGWRDIYCDIVSDFETVTAAQTTYDNTTSGLTATDVQGAVDELAEEKADKTDLSDMIPRSKSGTTLAQLVSAVNQLSTEQKHRCSIYINDNRTLTYTANGYFACMVVTGSTYVISQYRFDPTGSGSYARYINGGTAPDSQSITKWTLYYQGTPIT
jgi:hypothetical protein